MEVLFESFLRRKAMTPKTIEGYKQDVNMFLEYMEEKEIDIKKIREMDVKEYILTLMEGDYKNNTIARKNSALRQYFKFLRGTGEIISNPMEDIKQPELEKRFNEVNPAIIEELLSVVEIPRDRLMISLMYYEKIKPKDFLDLKKESYDEKQNILKLESKLVLLKEKTQEEIVPYIREKEENELLFISARKQKLTPSGVYYLIKKYLKEIGREEIRPIDFTKKEIHE